MKQVLNSVKLSIFEVKLTANGRVNLKYSINQSRTLETGCVPAPLGSPTDLQKRSYGHAPSAPYTVSGTPSTAVWGRVYGWVWGPGG